MQISPFDSQVGVAVSILFNLKTFYRGLTTNHARLEEDAEDPMLRPLRTAHSLEQVVDAIESWVSTQPIWKIESREGSENQSIKLHLTRTTKVIGFVDDIHLTVSRGDETRVEAESQSRVGKGDLGQNGRNLQELMSAINGALGSQQ